MPGIDVPVGIKNAGFKKGLDEMRGQASSFARDIGGKFRGAFSGIFAGLGGAGVLAGISSSLKKAADMESLQTSFKVLLGSAAAAQEQLAQLSQFAASTPFELPELANATRSLIAFGVESQQIMPTLRSIGDIASGVGQPIGELAELYGKAKVQGRLFAEDVNQLTGRGIPVIQEFARQFGVAESEVRGLVTAGSIGFANLEEAFKSLTSEGGKFHGMMQEQSETTAGKFSSMKDALSELQRTLAKDWLGPLKESVDWLTKAAEKAGEVKRILTGEGDFNTDTLDGKIESSKEMVRQRQRQREYEAKAAEFGEGTTGHAWAMKIANSARAKADSIRDHIQGATAEERAAKKEADRIAALDALGGDKGPQFSQPGANDDKATQAMEREWAAASEKAMREREKAEADKIREMNEENDKQLRWADLADERKRQAEESNLTGSGIARVAVDSLQSAGLGGGIGAGAVNPVERKLDETNRLLRQLVKGTEQQTRIQRMDLK